MIFSYRLLLLFFFVLITSCLFSACTNDSTPASTVRVLEAVPKENQQPYQNTLLQNYTYTQGKMMFSPQNIRLGGQSPILATRPSKRSRKGIHLHVSVNNQQHQLSNENIFDYPLEDGAYDLFAFVAHSYYESIKVPTSIFGRHITVKNGNLTGSRPYEQVALIYNTPIGTHEVTEKDSVLFDFVLYGTQLEEQGNYVALEINNQEPIRLSKWQAYYLTGLSEGEHHIRLTLNNSEGRAITPPIDNTFTVKKPTKEVK